MKFLSIDIETTGLEENAYMIEFAAVPFDTETMSIRNNLAFSMYIKCPSYEALEPNLNPWVRQNNRELIIAANRHGSSIHEAKAILEAYLDMPEFREFFEGKKPMLFGKSLSGVDLPFLSRDFGYEFMRERFSYQVMDLTSISYLMKDSRILPIENVGSSALMKHYNMGDVAHTALVDAINTANMYLTMLGDMRKMNNKINI